VPVFVALDEVTDAPAGDVKAVNHAKSAGMLVFNLFDLWNGRDKSSLRIGDWDLHPNAEGYKIVADRLAELIDQHRAELRIDAPAATSPPGTSAQK
jgi:hypothetical protein